jgi:hypothetical protein
VLLLLAGMFRISNKQQFWTAPNDLLIMPNWLYSVHHGREQAKINR